MIVDAVSSMQLVVSDYLKAVSAGSVVPDGIVGSSVPWRPHVYQLRERTGWQLHSVLPDSPSWENRIYKAQAVSKKLKVGVAATDDTLRNAEFLLACQKLDARVLLLRKRKDDFVVEAPFASVPDYICERRIKLDTETIRSMLDFALKKALAAQTNSEKGVALEVVVALLMSQVDNFEVSDIGISNRTQQMDVLVHNRNVGGMLGSSPLVLAEAKNWPHGKVTPTEHALFLRKLASRNKRAKLGFLVTTGKFTSGIALEARRDSFDDIIIVLVDGAALPNIWHGNGSITHQVERLVINASVGT